MSVGGGTPATPWSRTWWSFVGPALQQHTGREVILHNFARGATGPDFISSCFSRFLTRSYDYMLLEFGINHGNVTRLVEAIHLSTSTRVVLVTQLSCSEKARTAEQLLLHQPAYMRYHSAIYQYNLLDLVFENNLTMIYGSPCSDSSVRKIFKHDHHHLSDLGHQLLGSFVADALVSQHGQLQPNELLEIEQAVNETCFTADGGNLLGQPQTSIRDHFEGVGWNYTSDSFDRPDKTCWISRSVGSVLKSLQTLSFTAIEVFHERSFKEVSDFAVMCNNRTLATVYPRWDRPSSEVIQSLFDNLHACVGTLSIVNLGSPSDPAHAKVKICALILR